MRVPAAFGIAVAEKAVEFNGCIAMLERSQFRTFSIGKGRIVLKLSRHIPDQ